MLIQIIFNQNVIHVEIAVNTNPNVQKIMTSIIFFKLIGLPICIYYSEFVTKNGKIIFISAKSIGFLGHPKWLCRL